MQMIFLHLLTHVGALAMEGTIDNAVIQVESDNKKQYIIDDIDKNEYFKQEQKNALKNMCFGKLEIYKFRVDQHGNWWGQYNADFEAWQLSDYYKKYETIYKSPPWVFGGMPDGYIDGDKERVGDYNKQTNKLLKEIKRKCNKIFLITEKL